MAPRFYLLSLSSTDDEHPGTSNIAHSFECTIEQIAMGSNLNVEDAAFTLHHLGFLDTTQTTHPVGEDCEEIISITQKVPGEAADRHQKCSAITSITSLRSEKTGISCRISSFAYFWSAELGLALL
jgi:hypothetical protein